MKKKMMIHITNLCLQANRNHNRNLLSSNLTTKTTTTTMNSAFPIDETNIDEQTPTPKTTTSSTSTPIGILVGAIVGGVVVLFASIFLFVCLTRCRRDEKNINNNNKDLENNDLIVNQDAELNPYSPMPTEDQLYVSSIDNSN